MKINTLILIAIAACTFAASSGAQPLSPNPVANYANDPEWQKRFIGSYGFLSEREPRITAEERELIKTLEPYIPNDIPQAIRILEISLTLESSAALYYILGNFYFQLNNTGEAERYYRRALTDFPDFLRVHKNLGLLTFRQERYDDAMKHITKSLVLGDVEARTYLMLGYCLSLKEYHQSAESAFRTALMYEPDTRDTKMLLAQSLLQQSKYREASATFQELILERPNDAKLWFHQANAHMGLGEVDRAASNFEIVRRMGKASAASLFLLGDIYINKQMLGLALDVYIQAIDTDSSAKPNNPIRAAESLTNYGAYAQAKTLIRKINRVYRGRIEDKDELKILTLTAQIAIATGKGDEAAVALEKIVDRDPLNGRALLTLAGYFGREGQIEKAILLYERAQALDGEIQVKAFVKHGQMMVREKRWEDAVDLLRTAQSYDPRDHVGEYLEQVEKVARASGAGI